MQNNPKKSRAFIITFIAVLVLLVAGYFIFKNGGQIFGTKDSAIGKLFSPLLGTSKNKPVDVVNTNPSPGKDLTQNTVDVFNGNTNNDQVPLTPLPTPGSLNVGNQGPVVAVGDNVPKLPPAPAPTPKEEVKICPVEEELEYTDAEKDQLAELLRQYYLIAPELKTASEVAMINADVKRNQDLIDHADTLTLQCTEQKANLKYEGPKATKNNPYYGNLNIKPEFYAPKQFNDLEDELNIW